MKKLVNYEKDDYIENMDKNLFNNADDKKTIFKQYELYVSMADKISERRATANNFFIILTTALLAFVFNSNTNNALLFISSCVLGIIISIIWFVLILNYKNLNSAKFKIINEIENVLPVNIYSYEWEILKKGKSKKTYFPLSHIEKLVPLVFIIFYTAICVYQIAVATKCN